MGKVTQLWNPRCSYGLRRYWISFEDQIVIGGESREQAGVLSVRPACVGELRARLRASHREFEEAVTAGNDIEVWINGLKLFIGVKAVDDERMLVAFGIPPGSKVCLTLEENAGAVNELSAASSADRLDLEDGEQSPIGLCQTRH